MHIKGYHYEYFTRLVREIPKFLKVFSFFMIQNYNYTTDSSYNSSHESHNYLSEPLHFF